MSNEEVGATYCPKYGGKIMLDEEERCSLCEHPTAHGQIVSDNEIKFVTAYEITRHFGGPEEGGWWYDWYDPIDTVPTSDPDALVEAFKTKYEDRVEGDRFSVLGGTAVSVIIEDEPAESRSSERPHYA